MARNEAVDHWVEEEMKRRGLRGRLPTTKERIRWRRAGIRVLYVWEVTKEKWRLPMSDYDEVVRKTEEPMIHSPYIYAEVVEKKPKTKVWAIRNKKSDAVLALVRWYGPWRQYCLFTINQDAVFNLDCMTTLVAFLKQARRQHRQQALAELETTDD